MSGNLHLVIRTLPSGQVLVDDEKDTASIHIATALVEALGLDVAHAFTTAAVSRGRRYVFDKTPQPKPPTRLSETQALWLNRLQAHHNTYKGRVQAPTPYLMGGREYRTAEALERRGLVTIRYQGPSLGWVTITDLGMRTPTNH